MLKSARNTDKWINKVVKADCLKLLNRLETESIDLIVTDPPYGLHFLGKDWDKAIPSQKVWDECFRVLKNGSFIFVMSAPRMDLQYRMAMNLEKAGFDIGFTPIYWAYSSGFPKAMNIGKAIDKRAGVERKVIGQYDYPDGCDRPSAKEDMGFVQEYVKKHSGTYNTKRIVDRLAITEPATPEAKKLDGSYAGFQPKPAVEVVIVAMKPITEESYVDQALWNAKGITWLDNCRIPILNSKSTIGRFPANLLVSNDILNDGIERKGLGKASKRDDKSVFGDFTNTGRQDRLKKFEGDSGSFSRYYDLDLWFKEKFKEISKDKLELYPFSLIPKPSPSEKERGLSKFTPDSVNETFSKNYHPTVKPVKLMSYLISLASRDGDLVYDPFLGSGTTAVASKMLNRNYIGTDINKEWLRIATHRLRAVVKSFNLNELIE